MNKNPKIFHIPTIFASLFISNYLSLIVYKDLVNHITRIKEVSLFN